MNIKEFESVGTGSNRILPENLSKFLTLLTKLYHTEMLYAACGTEQATGVKKTYTGVQSALTERGRYVYPLTETDERVYTVSCSPDGYRIINVAVGQNIVLASLDDKTALVTTELHGCSGIGLLIPLNGDTLFALAHLNYHPERTMKEFTDMHQSSAVALSIPDGKNRMRVAQNMLDAIRGNSEDLFQSSWVDHYQGTSSMVVTNREVLILRRYGFGIRPVKYCKWSS